MFFRDRHLLSTLQNRKFRALDIEFQEINSIYFFCGTEMVKRRASHFYFAASVTKSCRIRAFGIRLLSWCHHPRSRIHKMLLPRFCRSTPENTGTLGYRSSIGEACQTCADAAQTSKSWSPAIPVSLRWQIVLYWPDVEKGVQRPSPSCVQSPHIDEGRDPATEEVPFPEHISMPVEKGSQQWLHFFVKHPCERPSPGR